MPHFQRLFSSVIGDNLLVNLNEQAVRDFPDPEENPLLDPKTCERWISDLHRRRNIEFSWGGYLEDRSWLWRGSYLAADRAVHLGIDINILDPAIPVRCPIAHRILHVLDDNDQHGGWGTRLLIETERGLVIFAHLDRNYIAPPVSAEWKRPYSHIGHLAPSSRNGGWFTHLHLQGIRDIGQLEGLDGYGPESVFNELNYPNPLKILGLID